MKTSIEKTKGVEPPKPQEALVVALMSYENRLRELYERLDEGEYEFEELERDHYVVKLRKSFERVFSDFKKSCDLTRYEMLFDEGIKDIVRDAMRYVIDWQPIPASPFDAVKMYNKRESIFIRDVLDLLSVLRRIVKRQETIPYHIDCWGSAGSWGYDSPVGYGLNAWWRNLEKQDEEEKKLRGPIEYPDWFESAKNAYLHFHQISLRLDKINTDDETAAILDGMERQMESLLAVLRTVDPFDEWDRGNNDENE